MIYKMAITTLDHQYYDAVIYLRFDIEHTVFWEERMTLKKFTQSVDSAIDGLYHDEDDRFLEKNANRWMGDSLPMYLKMEKEACEYYKRKTGDDFIGRGKVEIFKMWQRAEADRWKNEEMKKFWKTNCFWRSEAKKK